MQSLTQQTELTKEQKSLKQFLLNYDLIELEPQILDLQKEGFTFEFKTCAWNLSRVYFKQREIFLGVNCLEKPSYLKLVLAHEIAHVYENLEDIVREESKIKREINAWKRALAILNLLEDTESLNFVQDCINSYLKSESDLCMCPSCKEKREVKK